MKKISFIYLIIILLMCQANYAQNARLQSMGGLQYAISDADNSLNPYDMGGNPAWLYLDEKDSWLKVNQSFTFSQGDYKRLYDPKERYLENLSFEGVKTLGTKGTFLGYTSYSYDKRIDQNRSLKHDSYAGEAFFMTDTNSGDFRYNGPKVGFAYSFELVKDLFFGATISYEIFDGLKSTYSRASTLYREVGGNAGLAYKLSSSVALGAKFGFFDSQESIESKSEDLTEVEIFNFRGETYSTRDRSSTVTQKIKKKGINSGFQAYWTPDKTMEFGFSGSYGSSNTSVIFPKGYLINVEEGYAGFEDMTFKVKGKYSVNENLQLGAGVTYSESSSWSRNSRNKLKLWEWDIKSLAIGAGAAYKIPVNNTVVGFDYEFENAGFDSSKFIDKRFIDKTSGNHYIKLGLETQLIDFATLRAGINYNKYEHDLVTGGENVTCKMLFLGFGLKLSQSAVIDWSFQFGNLEPEGGPSKDIFNASAGVKLFTF